MRAASSLNLAAEMTDEKEGKAVKGGKGQGVKGWDGLRELL